MRIRAVGHGTVAASLALVLSCRVVTCCVVLCCGWWWENRREAPLRVLVQASPVRQRQP